MTEQNWSGTFEQAALPHLDAAYNLAVWLTRNQQDAEDVVQEAFLRAFRFFGGFHGRDARVWLMKIVRNTCYTWLHKNRPLQDAAEFDESFFPSDSYAPNPEQVVIRRDNGTLLRKAMEKLPHNFREILILRELEGLSYKEIANITGMPAGTVMSSLSRGRDRLRQALTALRNGDSVPRIAGGTRECIAPGINSQKGATNNITMTFRIARSMRQGITVFTLSGRMKAEEVADLKALFDVDYRTIVLDLRDVRLADRDAVKFLRDCEVDGMKLENCPAYVREWMEREKD